MKKSLFLAALALGFASGANAQFDSKLVVEEGTGAWCGFCPRGIVGFEAMSEKHPDDFIGIAIHNGDAMAFEEYIRFIGFNGFPQALCNRRSSLMIDPNSSSLESAYKTVTKSQVNGKVELSDVALSADKKSISFKVKATFGKESSKKYNLLVVTTEDNVNGPYQKNYFAGGGYGAMGGYENMPSQISPFVFQHVARSVYPELNFEGEELAASVSEGEVIEKEYTIPVASTVVNPYFMHVNVILLESGIIINGDKAAVAEVSEALPEGSAELSAGAYTDAGVRYNVTLTNPTDGVIYTSVRAVLTAASRAEGTYTTGARIVVLEPKETKTVSCVEEINGLTAGAYTLTVEATNAQGEYEAVGEPVTVDVTERKPATLKCESTSINGGQPLTDWKQVPVSARIACEDGTFYYRLTFRFHPAGEKKPLVAKATSTMLIEQGKTEDVSVVADLNKLKGYDNIVMDITTLDANKKTVYVAQDVPVDIDWAGISVIDADANNVPVEYFDLQGRRVAEPTTGLYIRRQGSDVKKVYIR